MFVDGEYLQFFFQFQLGQGFRVYIIGLLLGYRYQEKKKNEIFIICLNKIYCNDQNFMNRIFYYVYKFYCLVNFYFSR